MSNTATVLAFDFGASSGRAIRAVCDGQNLTYEEIHRFENVPIEKDGHLCWDVETLLKEIHTAIQKAGTFDSLGFDTWGVDFGLLDTDGHLLANPVHYRDARTNGKPEQAAARMPAEELYAHTGNQIMAINQNTVDLIPDPASYPECAGQGSPRTAIGWNITPDVLYYASKFWFERYGLPVLITENGFANNDFVMLDGKVYDPQRIDFLHRYLRQVARALEDGIPVLGYSYWSLFDNFEWAAGYDVRFGLIHVDYATQQRTLKDSALWYRDVIATNGDNL